MVKPVDINGRFLTQAVTGVQRYATEVVRALSRTLSADPDLRARYAFRMLTPRRGGRRLDLEHIPTVACGRLGGQAWEQFELPARVGRRLLLNLGNTAPVAARIVVTIHDAAVFAVPEAFSRPFRLWYRLLLPVLGRRAERVITISEFSRRELSLRAGIPQTKMVVIPQGCEHIKDQPADPGIFERLPVSPGGYILAVGSRSPHKNLDGVVRAVSLLGAAGLPLVVAGGGNPRIFAADAPTEGESLHRAGYVTDPELRALYEHALCFVYPSLYEGFGLPPLEAMICGCPVVVSRAASLPEVCGDAALYCDPRDPGDIARCIRTMVEEPATRAELRRRGLERAGRYTWAATAAALLQVLEALDHA